MKNLIFSIGDFDFYIPPLGYVHDFKGLCLSSFKTSQTDNFVASQEFLFNYDITLDYLQNKIELRPKPDAPSGNRAYKHRDDWKGLGLAVAFCILVVMIILTGIWGYFKIYKKKKRAMPQAKHPKNQKKPKQGGIVWREADQVNYVRVEISDD